ncbi:outer membrane lipoprotein carrier protein LolA [Aeromonas dhakensis]|uniref:outer membrane lipoprotein carrier protein LolA n=1 Tax=Aeromonas dhakensis TaxID=196024 RepID=UPI000362AB2F|nr:outer membrane lipoprotein carrier protein LolA [Aeromonas dhakensis]MBF8450547.1 outer membrane lipoprotein carrier protein LolA [Aeromonas dhakensis]MBQ4680719.1 outer membrane lipoprotein carrier protein LolA [Aeromonas dhakensis]MBW3730110.1 outer membrane lipoprotein carrier protein LolA [Aeromonas dhakensis]QSR54823.1 outer membrane lipoprotein carrier protein LolA [Aeromonas dhakensis]HDZ8844735.1 outer membrane lipoprotein carrier protein LolA [Aeromonas dhakensis]
MSRLMGPLLAGLILLLTWPLQAVPLSRAEVQQLLALSQAKEAHFEQEKQVAGLSQPLKASGELLLVRDLGLWWQQQKPFPLTLVLTPTRMVQQMAGQPATVIDNPQLLEFSQMLLALFGSDEATLSRYFSIDFHSTEDGWQLVLVPTLAPLDKVFASLTLSGQGQLDQLLIADKQGDSTRIRFSDWRERPLPLTPEEQARFAAH